jgi:hypothetical protein
MASCVVPSKIGGVSRSLRICTTICIARVMMIMESYIQCVSNLQKCNGSMSNSAAYTVSIIPMSCDQYVELDCTVLSKIYWWREHFVYVYLLLYSPELS